MFMEYMNKSEEKSNKVLSQVESLNNGLILGDKRYISATANICKEAISSTKNMI